VRGDGADDVPDGEVRVTPRGISDYHPSERTSNNRAQITISHRFYYISIFDALTGCVTNIGYYPSHTPAACKSRQREEGGGGGTLTMMMVVGWVCGEGKW
jgi:hypothetical protein